MARRVDSQFDAQINERRDIPAELDKAYEKTRRIGDVGSSV